jgi:hypothetical protein
MTWQRPTLPCLKDRVPSAMKALTSEFGMGSGIFPSLWSPSQKERPNLSFKTLDKSASSNSSNLKEIRSLFLSICIQLCAANNNQKNYKINRAISTG